MIVAQPNTSINQLLRLRVRETSSIYPLSCSIEYGSGDRWTTGSVVCSAAEYDHNDFLNISASINIPYGEVYSFQVYQTSGSNLTFKELYRGELMGTTQSVTIRNSEPFTSYTGSTTQYIIF